MIRFTPEARDPGRCARRTPGTARRSPSPRPAPHSTIARSSARIPHPPSAAPARWRVCWMSVERRFTVDKHDGFAADRNIESLGPVSERRPAPAAAFHRCCRAPALVGQVLGEPVASFQPAMIQPLVDHQRPGRTHHLHGPRYGPDKSRRTNSVLGQRISHPPPAHSDVVVGNIFDVELALIHRDDVGHERRRRVVLVSGHLGDPAPFAAELVPRRKQL